MSTSTQRIRENKQVASYWKRVSEREDLGFWHAPGWDAHQNILASGNPDYTWLQVFRDHLLEKNVTLGHALSIGCGAGSLERQMIKDGLCRSVDGCDLCEDRLKTAAQLASTMPINYFVSDLNSPQFLPQSYDLIIGSGIFHHVEKLEKLFENLKKALKPGGRLLMYDYVGPSRFQWTPSQMEHCNKWLRKLPRKFRIKRGYPYYYYPAKVLFNCLPFVNSNGYENVLKSIGGDRLVSQFLRLKTAQIYMDKLIPPHPDQFLVTDPSEAVRSQDIVPVIKNYFEVERELSLGGTLAQPLFGRTVANFIDYPEGQEWALKILEDERHLIQEGTLSSDFIAMVCKIS